MRYKYINSIQIGISLKGNKFDSNKLLLERANLVEIQQIRKQDEASDQNLVLWDDICLRTLRTSHKNGNIMDCMCHKKASQDGFCIGLKVHKCP